MKRFKFEDINDGYTFEVSDAEGLVGTISIELKTFMEDQDKQIKELQKLLRRVSMIYPQWRSEIKQALKE